MRSLTTAFVGLVLVTTATGQTPKDYAKTAQQLTNDRLWASAMHDLRHGGKPAAEALMKAFLDAASTRAATAELFARSLRHLGTQSVHLLPQLSDSIDRFDEPLRTQLLMALGNAALVAGDDARSAIHDRLKGWAAKSFFYSQSEDRPTYAWYAYVRLVRRMQHAATSATAADVLRMLERFRGERSSFNGLSHFAIDSFGAHGQREVLEAIADLAQSCTHGDMAPVCDELAGYLEHVDPREPRIVTEHCAGIGENPPNKLPGVAWPTKWLYDEWRFHCAEVVFARSEQAAQRELALRHLLHASNVDMRLRAIEALRLWPKPWDKLVLELEPGLRSENRKIVRATLITLLQVDEIWPSARDRLQQIEQGSDKELAALAKRALR